MIRKTYPTRFCTGYTAQARQETATIQLQVYADGLCVRYVHDRTSSVRTQLNRSAAYTLLQNMRKSGACVTIKSYY